MCIRDRRSKCCGCRAPCGSGYGKRRTYSCPQSPWTPIPPCTPSMATRWVDARGTTRRTKGRKAISRFSPSWRRPASTSRGNYATATGPTESRLRVTWRRCSRPCLVVFGASSRGRIPGSIAGKRCKPTRKPKQNSSWRPSPQTDADEQGTFWYQPEGWGKAYRFIAVRYRKDDQKPKEREQYQLFDTPQYLYRVFVTNMDDPIATLVWFYNQRAGAENLMKEANNDAGLAAHPSGRWATNCVHFQLVMLAYNLNCWLLLFNRAEAAKTDDLKHTTLATARLRFLFVAAKIWRHAGRVGISYSDQYQERGLFQRLMNRLRDITAGPTGFLPVLATPLSG